MACATADTLRVDLHQSDKVSIHCWNELLCKLTITGNDNELEHDAAMLQRRHGCLVEWARRFIKLTIVASRYCITPDSCSIIVSLQQARRVPL